MTTEGQRATRRNAPGWVVLRHSGPTNLERLDANGIDLRDITGSLGLINRYAGQTRKAIPVLWHSLMVHALCRDQPREIQLEALLHDAGEAYIGDWLRPLRERFSAGMEALRDQAQQAVYQAAGLAPPRGGSPAVREATGRARNSLRISYF